MEEFDSWKLLAGIGIFLFGMHLLEEAIKQLSGRAFRRFIRQSTNTPLKAIGAGTLATAILQSSSAVTLMVLAFVGAGVMGMHSAIGVILGSNLGTTFTAWIIAAIGFKVKIEVIALPLVAIGSLSFVFWPGTSKWKEASRAFIGFGFLFMGLDYLKSSIGFLSDSIDLGMLPDWGIFSYLLLGFILTAVIQSSSAAMAIALSGIHAGIMDFEQAALIVIGINLGTTITVLLGAINAVPIKKRVAFSHVLFNLGTGLLALLFLPGLTWLVKQVFSTTQEPVLSLALFHSLFNLAGILVFLPLIGLMAALLQKLFPDRQRQTAFYINHLASIDVAAGLVALTGELRHLLFEVMQHNLLLLQIPSKPLLAAYHASIKEFAHGKSHVPEPMAYEEIKQLQAEIISFGALLQQKELNPPEAAKLNACLDATRIAAQAAKTLKDVKHELDRLQTDDSPALRKHFDQVLERQEKTYADLALLLDHDNAELIMAELIRLNQQTDSDDEFFLAFLTRSVGSNTLAPDFISTTISVNRGLVFSIKQLIRAITALKLPAESARVIEHLADQPLPVPMH